MCQHIFDPGLVMIHGYPLFFVGSLRPILLNLVHYLAKGTWSRSNYYRCQLSPCPFHSHVVAAALCKFVNTCCPSWIWNVTAPLPHYLFWSKNCGMALPLTFFFFLTGPMICSFYFGTLQNNWSSSALFKVNVFNWPFSRAVFKFLSLDSQRDNFQFPFLKF